MIETQKKMDVLAGYAEMLRRNIEIVKHAQIGGAYVFAAEANQLVGDSLVKLKDVNDIASKLVSELTKK